MNAEIHSLYTHYLATPSIFIDSRKVNGPGLFFAIKGPTFNGNEYALSAIDRGATWAIVDEAESANHSKCLLVENALETMQLMAAWHRKQFNIPVIAITGTNGKTTTKELVKSILSLDSNCLVTQGNQNNYIGVPLTLLRLTSEHKIIILEMGANQPGDIHFLCKLSDPTLGLITNIGRAHLEGFGNLDIIKNTKKELFDYITNTSGTFLAYTEEELIMIFASQYNGTYTYGSSANNDYIINIDTEDFFLKGNYYAQNKWYEFNTQLFGSYNAGNVKAAVALSLHLRVPAEYISKGLQNFTSKNNRSQIIKKSSYSVVLDAYNANPDSMAEALHSFGKIDSEKKILILGDMKELGDQARREHKKIIELIGNSEWHDVVLIGKEFNSVTNKMKYHSFLDIAAASQYLSQIKVNRSWILVKGSRAIALEKCLDYLPA